MSTKSKLISTGMQLALSDTAQILLRGRHELQRRLKKSAHVVTAYIRPDDPYSLLLVRRIRDLVDAYDITVELKLTGNAVPSDYFPAPAALAEYARGDVARLAAILGEEFANKPSEQFLYGVVAIAALETDGAEAAQALDPVLELMEAYWAGDERRLSEVVAPLDPMRLEKARQIIERSTAELVSRGHYGGAMLYYGGEWYWGIDRLHYLLDRLDGLGLQHAEKSTAHARLRSLVPALNPALPAAVRRKRGGTLEFYHSFRSPYSYIALQRTFGLADRFGLELDIRPVMPMVLRGLPVPRAKRLYIVRDVKREAKRYGVPYGKMADPLGAAERCIELFIEARKIGRERELLLAVGRAAWADGVDLNDQDRLVELARSVGITYERAMAALGSGEARALAQQNRDRLQAAGLWGVPAFRTKGIDLWGQDRLGVLTHHLLR